MKLVRVDIFCFALTGLKDSDSQAYS